MSKRKRTKKSISEMTVRNLLGVTEEDEVQEAQNEQEVSQVTATVTEVEPLVTIINTKVDLNDVINNTNNTDCDNVKIIKSLLGMDDDCITKQVTITPSVANQLLKFNTHNRKPKEKFIALYATDMKNGNFKLQESMITFDDDGVLTNGQNRLYACVRSESNFETIVHIGLEQNKHMDSGAKRNTIENIQLSGDLKGIMNDNSMSLKAVNSLFIMCNNNMSPNIEDLVEFCKNYGDKIDDLYNNKILIIRNSPNHLFKAEIAAAFIAAYINGVELDDLKHVRKILSDGMSSAPLDHLIQKYRDKVQTIGKQNTFDTRKKLYCGAQHMIYHYSQRNVRQTIKLNEEYYDVFNKPKKNKKS